MPGRVKIRVSPGSAQLVVTDAISITSVLVLPSKLSSNGRIGPMNTYKRHRFPPLGGPPNHQLRRLALLQIQSQARGNSHRDVEDLLAERGITVSREAIRL